MRTNTDTCPLENLNRAGTEALIALGADLLLANLLLDALQSLQEESCAEQMQMLVDVNCKQFLVQSIQSFDTRPRDSHPYVH